MLMVRALLRLRNYCFLHSPTLLTVQELAATAPGLAGRRTP